MNPDGAEPAEEYVQARRVLLDALEALAEQRRAVVLVGAQAVYLRAGAASLAIADFTTDADLVLDPAQLSDDPTLIGLMEAAGFSLDLRGGVAAPGAWQAPATINGIEVMVPVDLIVPREVAPPGGTRGARLGPHGKRAARLTNGLEAALVDNGELRVDALQPDDGRSMEVCVAGFAALLVSKLHKVYDRVASAKEHRLADKDASDIVRLMQTSSPNEVGTTLGDLRGDAVAGPSTEAALVAFGELFGSRAGVGIEMASRALRLAMPEDQVRAICLQYTEMALARSLG